jgi:hypothetical protein
MQLKKKQEIKRYGNRRNRVNRERKEKGEQRNK